METFFGQGNNAHRNHSANDASIPKMSRRMTLAAFRLSVALAALAVTGLAWAQALAQPVDPERAARAAILSDEQLGVRYAADGVSCNATMQSHIGVRLYK
jgi:hypothetical protein